MEGDFQPTKRNAWVSGFLVRIIPLFEKNEMKNKRTTLLNYKR